MPTRDQTPEIKFRKPTPGPVTPTQQAAGVWSAAPADIDTKWGLCNVVDAEVLSLREALEQIGEPGSVGSSVRIPSDFHSVPSPSLRKIMRAMRSPLVETWTPIGDDTEFDNEDWTDECQGLTSIGQSWYLVSNADDRKAVYRFAFGSWDSQGSIELPPGIGKHVGAPASHDGVIFVPVDDGFGPHVWMIDAELTTNEIAYLGDKPGVKDDGDIMGWCAINPWNGFYYTSGGHHRRAIHCYDPNQDFAYQGSIGLRDAEVNGIQGGRITASGHMYINSDARSAGNQDLTGTKDVRAYSTLNGFYFGSCAIDYDPGSFTKEEMEGFTFVRRKDFDGNLSYIHVLIYDNDILSGGDIRIVHLTTPFPKRI